jgi:hypothetical protein
MDKYKIPDEFFFRLHHVRPRFKNDVEEVLLYVATSISEMLNLSENEFSKELNTILFAFKKNISSTQKTIDNWRTEISALFGFIQENENYQYPSLTARRLAGNQYLDEFFNYFLLAFQYPGGHIKPHNIVKQIQAGVKFKPCKFVLNLLIEGEYLTGKPFYITAEELTQCAYFDLRVTRDFLHPRIVAETIIKNRASKLEYDHCYSQLWNSKTQSFPSKGDVYRYAGDILDYMVLANLLKHKGTGYYYYLNELNDRAINYHLKDNSWFYEYDVFFNSGIDSVSKIAAIEASWFDYVNEFQDIIEFSPQLDSVQISSITSLVSEYYTQMKGERKIPTKIIGDYGETLILVHEYLRTREGSNRQHLINKIPTPLGVGFDLQSIELDKGKRYIEVKTTKSRKSINQFRFKLTPNEWDTEESLRELYFIYYLVINDEGKSIFVINNPVEQFQLGNLKVDKNFVVEITNRSGEWQKLLEVLN